MNKKKAPSSYSKPRERRLRIAAAAIAVLATRVALSAFHGAARAGEVPVPPPHSGRGRSWRIAINYEKRTVDSNPARISDTEILWRDAKTGWKYTLDRKSGAL